jgi:anthranilate synthase/aminodeoxychorismate synthase-like glutamine amidotransferase
VTSPRVVLVDNHDSFTFNLVQALRVLGASCLVVRHDALSVEDVIALAPDGVLLGPGPCTPEQAGITLALIPRLAGRIPVLGVCLGHQAIGHALGARVVRADRLLHGKTSPVHHDGSGLYRGLPCPFEAGRYNSLLLDPATLPPCLRVTARSETGEILGIVHRDFPLEGVQFHPESFLTPLGPKLLGNWLSGLGGERHECLVP